MNVVQDGENRELHYHYYNTAIELDHGIGHGGVGIYIIAAVNYFPVGKGVEENAPENQQGRRLFDWAVYLGASLFGSHRMEMGVQWAAEHGEKLGLEYAKHWFPYLPEERYRR